MKNKIFYSTELKSVYYEGHYAFGYFPSLPNSIEFTLYHPMRLSGTEVPIRLSDGFRVDLADVKVRVSFDKGVYGIQSAWLLSGEWVLCTNEIPALLVEILHDLPATP